MLAEEPQLAGLVRGEELGASAPRNSLENTGTGSKKRAGTTPSVSGALRFAPIATDARMLRDTFSRPDVRT
jgi:hypothetical protein